jgi:AcrR family transcriptional regulator
MSPKVSAEHLEKRRKQILDAAKTVFMQKGFEPTTMQDVITESGMSRGGVYSYFSSTEDMFEAIQRENIELFPTHVEKLLNDHETVWDALVTFFKGFEKKGSLFGMVSYEYSVTAWRNERHRQYIQQNFDKALESYTTFFQAGVKTGEFHPKLPLEEISRFVINVADGFILEHHVLEKDIKNQVESLILYLREVLDAK